MTSEQARVVVGVDGGAGGAAALAWALRYAEAVDALVDLVHVYDTESDVLYGGLYPSLDAQRSLDARESRVLDEADAEIPPELARQRHLVRGGAGRALVERSRDAALLVVGATSRHPVARALLGSTADHCARHAECPVVVVPAAPDTRPGERRRTAGAAHR